MRHLMRRLLRAPSFTAIALATIAIGIGANTAIFSVVNGVLLKPLPYPDAERLVGLWHTAPIQGIQRVNMAAFLYFTYRDQSRAFEDVGLWDNGAVSVTGLAEPERVQCLFMTDGTLPILGVKPALGRWFSRKDDSPGSPETAILSYGYWKRRFGGDPSVIGKRIVVDSKAREVIGVLPQDFWFLDRKTELILPFQFDRNKIFLGNFSFQGVARLKPGITLAQANADVARMIPIAIDNFPPPPGFSRQLFKNARIAPAVQPFKKDAVGDVGGVLWVLMGTIGLVLLIACANVANLLLVRAEGRQQELAIRAALGAGWGRIARELLLESLCLGLAGGALGLALAYASVRALVAFGPTTIPRLTNISIDPLVLLFTLGISLFAGLLFGAIPVLKYAGPQIANALRSGGRTLSHSRERHRARSTLVIVQVALALVLLIGSGLMIRSLQAMRNVQPGFTHPEQVETFRVSIPEAEIKDGAQTVRMQQAILEKIKAIPGVSSASFGSFVPLDGNQSSDVLYAEDKSYAEGQIPPIQRYRYVAPQFFSTLGIPLIAGRSFTWTDLYDKRLVTMVSDNMARELWGSPAAALGKRIREGSADEWREIIGVVGDLRQDGNAKPAPTTVYWPALMTNFYDGRGNKLFIQRSAAFAVRSTRTGSPSFLKEVEQAVWSVNPNLPVANIRTLDELYSRSMARTSFTLVMLGIAGAMALLLGIVGIYGVIAYSVTQRTREIGIRMALGAQSQELTGMFVRHGLMLAAIGVACGLAAAVALTRLMASLLFDVRPVDPLTYGAVAVVLVAATVIASYVPARKATSVDPLEALRAE
jgi:putative ABC transport system permease protein